MTDEEKAHEASIIAICPKCSLPYFIKSDGHKEHCYLSATQEVALEKIKDIQNTISECRMWIDYSKKAEYTKPFTKIYQARLEYYLSELEMWKDAAYRSCSGFF